MILCTFKFQKCKLREAVNNQQRNVLKIFRWKKTTIKLHTTCPFGIIPHICRAVDLETEFFVSVR